MSAIKDSISQAVDRLVGIFPGERQNQARLQISACLVGVVYQRLIPKVDGGQVAAFGRTVVLTEHTWEHMTEVVAAALPRRPSYAKRGEATVDAY